MIDKEWESIDLLALVKKVNDLEDDINRIKKTLEYLSANTLYGQELEKYKP